MRIDICRRVGHFKRNTNLMYCSLHAMSNKFIDFEHFSSSANKHLVKRLLDENLKSTKVNVEK